MLRQQFGVELLGLSKVKGGFIGFCGEHQGVRERDLSFGIGRVQFDGATEGRFGKIKFSLSGEGFTEANERWKMVWIQLDHLLKMLLRLPGLALIEESRTYFIMRFGQGWIQAERLSVMFHCLALSALHLYD